MLLYLCIGQVSTLKSQSERQAIDLLFKVQTIPNHLSRNTNKSGVITSKPIFLIFSMLSMEFPIRNCLPFFFQTYGNLTRLSCHKHTNTGQKSQQIADYKNQMPSDIKPSTGTKIYYCFNSKGDHFNVNEL